MMENLSEVIASIPSVSVVDAEVGRYTSESQHTALSFDLAREAALLSTSLSHVAPGGEKAWNIEQAVVFGHFVRLTKLLRSLLVEASERRGEMAWIVTRLTVECIVNVRYLLKHLSPSLLQSYLHQSLQNDAAMRRSIQSNVSARGSSLHIEERMLGSIERAFSSSEVRIEDLPSKRIRNWGGKDFMAKLTDLGRKDSYLGLFGAPSANVHGGWADLRLHHLEVISPGQFKPRTEPIVVRPQMLHAVALLSVEALQDLIEYLGIGRGTPISDRLADLLGRIHDAMALHEGFLQAR